MESDLSVCVRFGAWAGKELFYYGDWIRQPGVAICSCNDGLRPVIMKLEATDIPSQIDYTPIENDEKSVDTQQDAWYKMCVRSRTSIGPSFCGKSKATRTAGSNAEDPSKSRGPYRGCGLATLLPY